MAYAPVSTQTSTAEAALLGEYWDSETLDNLWPEAQHHQFAEKKTLPGGVGKTIHFTRFTKFADAKMTALSEVSDDVLSPSLMSATEISATVVQYGHGVLFSDFLLLTARFNLIDEALAHLGMEAGRWVDTYTVDTAIKFNGVQRIAGAATDIASTATLTVDDAYYAATKLATLNAKRFRTGSWAAVGHPAALHHIKAEGEMGGWFELNKYVAGSQRELKSWSIGRISNIDFFESTINTMVASNDSSAPAASVLSFSTASAYVTRVFSPGAFGAVNLEGGGVSTYVKKLGSAGWRDLINQRAGVGLKIFYGVKDLDMSNRCVEIFSGLAGIFE